MRFFTRQWLSGELTDDEYDAMPGVYWRHVASLQLPPDVAELSGVNLHDARVLDVSTDPPAERLMLRLRCGDLQRGYTRVDLIYATVRIDAGSLVQLHRAMASTPDEILMMKWIATASGSSIVLFLPRMRRFSFHLARSP